MLGIVPLFTALAACTGADYAFKPEQTPCRDGFGMAADGNCYPLAGDSGGPATDSASVGDDSGGESDSGTLILPDTGPADTGSVDTGEPACSGLVSEFALSFDGNNDVVQLDAFDTSALTAMTVEVWVYYDGGGDYNQRIVANRSGDDDVLDPFSLLIAKDNPDAPDAVEFGFCDGRTNDGGWGVHSARPLPKNTWTHVAATYDRGAGTVIVYLDAVVEGSGVAPYEAAAGSYPLWLGGDPRHTTDGRFLSGAIDEFVLWDHVRTPEQIACDMASGVTGSEAGILLAWRMEAGSGQVVEDLGPAGLDGRVGTVAAADPADPQWVSGVSP